MSVSAAIGTNGEERYLLCLGNIYGLPTSGRTYAVERDRILMEILVPVVELG